MKDSGVDRRKYARIDAVLNARFVIIGEGGERDMTSRTVQAKTKSVSTNGACLRTNVVQVDGLHIRSSISGLGKNKLQMEIDLPAGFGSIAVRGEVSWYDLTPENDEYLYNVGVTFTGLSEDAREALRSYMTQQRKERKTRLGFLRKWFSRA